MPVSRQRKKKTKPPAKYTRAEIDKINTAFDKKFREYLAYPIEQLNVIKESKTEKGAYLAALERAIQAKEHPQTIS